MNAPEIWYAVLNWGLGHASRSAPLIEALERRGYRLRLASDGAAGAWLRARFPHLPYWELPAYQARYARHWPAWAALVPQLPRLARRARAERLFLARCLQAYPAPQALISDNRLGWQAPGLRSLYLSHQFQLATPPFSPLATFLHRYYWRSFSALAVPDAAGSPLAGKLARPPASWGERLYWLGPLSHLAGRPELKRTGRGEQRGPLRVTAVLSGPEPQRSLLEGQLAAQARSLPQYRWTLVRGCEGPWAGWPGSVYGRLGSGALAAVLAQTDVVVGRSGYSSLMDYQQAQLPAVLIPTPGQGEQEYLAAYHAGQGHAVVARQGRLDLSRHIPAAREVPGWPMVPQPEWEGLFGFLEGK